MNNFAEPIIRVSVPEDSYANLSLLPDAAPPITTDNPPWGAGVGLGVWLASVLLLLIVPMLAIIPYIGYLAAKGLPYTIEALTGNANFIVISLAGTIPAHLLTLLLVWAVVTGWRKRPFGETIGWSISGWPEIVLCVVLAVALLVMAGLLVYFFGNGQETQLELILRSSPLARYTGALLAVATAPIVEEAVYRGVLYGGLRKATNTGLAIILVTFLFALVHVDQYRTNPSVIVVILLLSLTLTSVRAYTGRVLPCVIIHTVFNGIQAIGLVSGYDLEKNQDALQPQVVPGVHFILTFFN